MVMPKLSGKELALRLREDHPVLPVVFMSGYAYAAAGGDEPTAGDASIHKPFSMHDLVATVRAQLDARVPDKSPA
jgi:FixJ family two-component response regulator